MKTFFNVTVCLATAYLLSSCDYKRDFVEPSSPLGALFARGNGKSTFDEARKLIFQTLPPGSPESAVDGYIKKNFRSAPRITASRIYQWYEGKPYICIRVRESSTFPAGGSKLEIVFVLSPDRKLSDIVIYDDGAFL